MSKPAPPPAYSYAAASAASAHQLPSDDSNDWLSVGFVNDSFSAHCQRAQGRPFLRTGVRPAIGQRIELTIFLTSEQRGQLPFRLSGEVVNDRVSIMPGCGGMGIAEKDTAVDAGGIFSASTGISHCPEISTWRPSKSTDDCGVTGGSVSLAHMVRSLIMQQHPTLAIAPEHYLESAWKTMSNEKKEQVSNAIVKKLGALHGQKVVCEGRLNFDYDIRRGTEDGPWVDGIPFDGRDIWQFTLVADDSMENLWRADPSSFVSLGPMHRPRCWPWSNDNDLPYERGDDAPLRGPGPSGAISVHICVGPHGCSGNGKDHRHSYQSQAA